MSIMMRFITFRRRTVVFRSKKNIKDKVQVKNGTT